jgi:hypothetical protein
MNAQENTNKAPRRRAGAKWEFWGFIGIVAGICTFPASKNLATAMIAVGFIVFLVGRFKG